MSTLAAETPLSFAVESRDRGILRMVENAVREKNVRLAFQPVVQSTHQDTPVFFEALIRLLDDTGRVIPARDFMSAVETHEIGRIMDCLALEKGFAALAADRTLKLSINLSARSIGYRRWLKTLEDGIADTPDIAGRLILEITEESAMVMPDVVQAFMKSLQKDGILFALDDFGAGYTSFRYLKRFLFDIIKIDGQFIRDIHKDADNQVLLQALVDIGRHFDMITVAENVESEREAAYLTAAGIDCLQGYLFGAPALKPVRNIRQVDPERG